MIFIKEDRKKRILTVYHLSDSGELGTRLDWYHREVERYHNRGYSINQIYIPAYNQLTPELQKWYNNALYDKAIFDSFVNNGTETFFYGAIQAAVEERLSFIDNEELEEIIRDILENMAAYKKEILKE